MTARHRWLRGLVWGLLLIGNAQAGEPKFFDAHIHYNEDASAALSPAAAMKVLDQAGVARALVSSTPNDGTHALHEKYPERVVASLRPYRTAADRGRWFDDPEIAAFIERQLARGSYRAIGEFHLYTGQGRTDVIKRIVTLAARHDLVLHCHCDVGAVGELFAIDPKAKILWAHAGVSADPHEIAPLLERHERLWVELSLRGVDVAPGGKLAPAWRALLVKYPDRFMIGTDTWAVERWDDVESEMAAVRRWLRQLPREIADRIARGNADRLFPERPDIK